jgi:predicted NodU family carbamoyl transferase
MRSNFNNALVALAAVAALAVPVTAAAHGGHGAKQGKAANHGKGAQRTRALNLKGTVAAVAADSVQVSVLHANHHGSALVGATVTVDLTKARIVVRDVNGDGARDLADVAVGDRVLVQARIDIGATPHPATPIVAKRLVDKGAPKAPATTP